MKELLGDVGHVDLILVRLETTLMSVHDGCTVCAKRTIGSEIIWTHSMELLDDKGHVESSFSLFRDSAKLDAR